MSVNKELEFNNIINDILKNDKFIELRYEIHHGMSRLDHCLSVAKMTYNMAKFLHLKNVEEVTRAALLHDFFKNSEVGSNSFKKHPLVALKNAKENFELTKKQENIIASHMFPVCEVMPKCSESLLVSLVDKLVAIKECTKEKIPLTIGTAFLFFINISIINR